MTAPHTECARIILSAAIADLYHASDQKNDIMGNALHIFLLLAVIVCLAVRGTAGTLAQLKTTDEFARVAMMAYAVAATSIVANASGTGSSAAITSYLTTKASGFIAGSPVPSNTVEKVGCKLNAGDMGSRRMAGKGDYIYAFGRATNGAPMLAAYAVAENPGDPPIKSWVVTTQTADITIFGDHLFCTTNIIGISNPAAMSIVGHFFNSNVATMTVATTNHAYTRNGKVVDWSNAARPIITNTFDVSPTGTKFFDFLRIDQQNARLYGVCSWSNLVSVYTLTNPFAPVLIGGITNPGFGQAPNGMDVQSNYVFVGVERYGAPNNHIYIYDASTPTNFILKSIVSNNLYSVEMIVVKDNFLYAASWGGPSRATATDIGLGVVDITDKSKPASHPTLGIANPQEYPVSVAVCDNYAAIHAVGGGSELCFYQLHKPAVDSYGPKAKGNP